MRWFKHLSMAHNDEALSTLLETMGPEAYGMYWLILEHFASVMDKGCTSVPELTNSDIRWAQICSCSVRKFRKFAETAAELKLISSSSAAELKQFESRLPANRLKISVPKLLKYRDEYSKKSGHSPDSRTDTDTDGEDKLNTSRPPAAQPDVADPEKLAELEKVEAAKRRDFAMKSGVERLFDYYCRKFARDPKRYTLTDARRKKALLRLDEREKIRGNLDDAIAEAKLCIDNLAASDHHRSGGYIDWTDQIFRSAEEFEKRLNWIPPQGVTHGTSRGNITQSAAERKREREQDAFRQVFGDVFAGADGSGDWEAGSPGQGQLPGSGSYPGDSGTLARVLDGDGAGVRLAGGV